MQIMTKLKTNDINKLRYRLVFTTKNIESPGFYYNRSRSIIVFFHTQTNDSTYNIKSS